MGNPLKYKIGDKINDWLIKGIIPGETVKYKIVCVCGKESICSSKAIFKKTKCRFCTGKKKSDQYIGKYIGNFKILDNPIVNGKRVLLAKCKCGNEYFSKKDQLTRNKSCKKCCGGNFPGKVMDGCTLIEIIAHSKWRIKCHCGNIYISQPRYDKRPEGMKFRDCGCTKNRSYMERIKNKIGYKFGKLKVIDVEKGNKHNILICKCKCGKIKRVINGHEYKQASCGCLKSENTPTAEKKGNARFKNFEILTMRELYQSKIYTVLQLSEMFQASESYILRIVKGHIWKTLPCPEENKIKRHRPKTGPYKKKKKHSEAEV